MYCVITSTYYVRVVTIDVRVLFLYAIYLGLSVCLSVDTWFRGSVPQNGPIIKPPLATARAA